MSFKERPYTLNSTASRLHLPQKLHTGCFAGQLNGNANGKRKCRLATRRQYFHSSIVLILVGRYLPLSNWRLHGMEPGCEKTGKPSGDCLPRTSSIHLTIHNVACNDSAPAEIPLALSLFQVGRSNSHFSALERGLREPSAKNSREPTPNPTRAALRCSERHPSSIPPLALRQGTHLLHRLQTELASA